MNGKFNKTAILFIIALSLFFAFYPNRINRYIKRKLRVYNTAPKDVIDGIMFQKVDLDNTIRGQFTTLTIGPDHKLYAAEIDGRILRFKIKPSGELKLEHTFKPYGEFSKFTIGLAFDPFSTPDSLVVWTSNSETNSGWAKFESMSEIHDNQEWAGNISRIHLSNSTDEVLLSEVIITELPRFGPNQENFANSLVFGPTGKLYFGQGANTGMGLCNCKENEKPFQEALLSGTILSLDTKKLPKELPLNVKTKDGKGKFDPFQKNSPLKIYATGVRNAYDLVWHNNGNLYTTINGSGGNENTPTSNPDSPFYIAPLASIKYKGPKDIPALIGAHPDQNDFMIKVEKGGYYGHPNPIRAEYILNRGNKDVDNFKYNGIVADANFRGFSYDFGPHVAPTGIIEYKSKTFNGKLQNCILVTRMQYNDIIILRPGDVKKDLVQDFKGSEMGLVLDGGPLDLIEDTKNGNIYVSGFNNLTITLFKPIRKENYKILSSTNEKFNKRLKTGKTIFQQNCQTCHGKEGQGAIAPNLINDKEGKGKENIKSIIKNGSANGAMPAWKNKLSNDEIIEVSNYVLSLKQ
ncbi:c-type cytochrome [Maribacter sp. 1_MG-2023]|uniref:c-type cytochrome n=1 Tax=Maribacter sp. 1_MG-2023 TaxID=3062677 RepID=UPI0026E16D56|nr:c-type cytochrome [Maribacter sp. 1_MG-2023]MDO6471541.1 c-type cytochrome [Maribacter sp. 1_MG-2023]